MRQLILIMVSVAFTLVFVLGWLCPDLKFKFRWPFLFAESGEIQHSPRRLIIIAVLALLGALAVAMVLL
jgi:hypothetical protein